MPTKKKKHPKEEPPMWMSQVGKNIKRCIKEAGLTQKKVAEDAGIDPGQLSRIINGHENDIMLSTLYGVINAIGCSADDVLGRKHMELKKALEVIGKFEQEYKK